jgi:hypothetical protein
VFPPLAGVKRTRVGDDDCGRADPLLAPRLACAAARARCGATNSARLVQLHAFCFLIFSGASLSRRRARCGYIPGALVPINFERVYGGRGRSAQFRYQPVTFPWVSSSLRKCSFPAGSPRVSGGVAAGGENPRSHRPKTVVAGPRPCASLGHVGAFLN